MTRPNTKAPRPIGALHPRVTNTPLDLLDVIMEDVEETLWKRGLSFVPGQKKALRCCGEAELTAAPGEVKVSKIPPGGAKSTLIRSSLKAVACEFSLATPIAETLGGVVVVVETIKEGRELLKLCESVAPGTARLVESPNASNTKDGCIAGLATKYSECPGRACPDADRCPILTSGQRMHDTPILIITHSRYKFYAENFIPLRDWYDASGAVHFRELLLIDEAPELVEKNELSPSGIHHTLSDMFETKKFHSLNYLEREFWYKLQKPFNQLRQKISGTNVFQTIPKATLREEHFTELGALENSLRECALKPWFADEVISTFRPLYGEGHAYYYKSRGQALLSPRVKTIHGEGKPATIIFTGTAGLIPALAHNENFEIVDSSFPVNGSRLTLHIQHGDVFTFSKSVAGKKKNRAGCLAWTEYRLREMQAHHKQALVVTYNDQAERFWNTLSPKFPDFLVPFQERDGSKHKRIPYFGGMNGSNLYGTCTGMVIAGLHRFRPEDYLAEAVALASVSTDWAKALAEAGNDALPLITRMQDILLANDLVQAIFRTNMRNHSSDKHVDVWLLQPPDDVVRYVQAAFPGCQVEHVSEVPQEVVLSAVDEDDYGGGTPHYVPLLKVLYELPVGTRTTPREIYSRAGLTDKEYKEARRNKHVQAFLRDHVQSKGGGVNTTYLIVESKGA